MNIYDLVYPEEIEELSDEGREAFAEFVRIAETRYREWVKDIPQDEDGWYRLQEARIGFMSTVIAAGKKYGIEPFENYTVPEVRGFTTEDFDQFKSDLDHYIAQIVLDLGIRRKRDSVGLDDTTRSKIRTHIGSLRDCIDRADLDDRMRSDLLRKLAEFEAVLEKRRLSLLSVTLIAVALLGAPSSVWGSADIVHKLVSNIMGVVAEAKVLEDATRKLPPIDNPTLLQPPRNAEKRPSRAPAFESDDDIPF